MKTILDRSDLQPAERAFARAYHLSRRWNKLVALAIQQWGDVTGTHISGIYADHFPEHAKDKLRKTAQAIGKYLDEAWALRPSGVRHRTMMALKHAVITRDGKGYYG